eukprot:1732026-Ditylum_brightwellii.AAC.1
MLNHTTLPHQPIQDRSFGSSCQLHCWAAGEECNGQTIVCETFNITLCTACFGVFHSEYNLVNMKKRLGEEWAEMAIRRLRKDVKRGGGCKGHRN